MASATAEDLHVSEGRPLRVNKWSESLAWAYAGCLGVLGLYVATFLQPQGPNAWAYRGIGLLLLIVSLSIVRSVTGGIWVRPDGVRIRTRFRTYELSWSAIRSFQLRRKAPCLAVELNDGRTIGVFGLQASRSREQDRADELVAMLNRSLMAGRLQAMPELSGDGVASPPFVTPDVLRSAETPEFGPPPGPPLPPRLKRKRGRG